MKRWNIRYSGNCPFCQFPNEDTTHVLQCEHTTQQDQWKKLLTAYKLQLLRADTNYYLRKAIVRDIKAWQ